MDLELIRYTCWYRRIAALPKIQTVRGPHEIRKLFGYKSTNRLEMASEFQYINSFGALLACFYFVLRLPIYATHCHFACHIKI